MVSPEALDQYGSEEAADLQVESGNSARAEAQMLLTQFEAQMRTEEHVLLSAEAGRLGSSPLLGRQSESSHKLDYLRKS